MITIVAKHVVQDDQIGAFIDLARELIAETRKESGCIKYSLYADSKQKNILTFIEEWKSNEAIDLHFKSSHFTRIVPQLKKLAAQASEINLYKEVQ